MPQERSTTRRRPSTRRAAALAQAKAQVSLAEEGRRRRRERVGEARGRVSQSAPIEAQIAAARANADLAHARVQAPRRSSSWPSCSSATPRSRAPADGFASKLTVHEGQLVAIGQPVDRAGARRTTYVIANFKETQIGKMQPGQRGRDRRSTPSRATKLRRQGREPLGRHRRQLLAAARRQRRRATSSRSCSASRCASPGPSRRMCRCAPGCRPT